MLNLAFQFITAIIKIKTRFLFKALFFLFKIIGRLFMIALRILDKINADSSAFLVIFLSLGFYFYGNKFNPASKTR